MSSYDYDFFTIGAGSGGVRAARWASGLGAKVAIAEDRFLGGTCVNVGCVPKKLFVYAAHVHEDMKDAAGYGWTASGTFDWATLKKNKDEEIARLNTIYGRVLHGAGVELMNGRARIVAPHTVEVTDKEGNAKRVTAEHILVATGGHPVRPTEPGTEKAWVSDDVFEMEELPKRILVVGGGYIALEMAGIFHGLGVETTLAYRGPHPLRGFDDDTRFYLCEEIRKKGINLMLNTKVEMLDHEGENIEAMMSFARCAEVDAVLYAIGRRPNTANLGLEELGVEMNDKGAIVVDDHYRANVPGIYAIGDVTDRINLTPVAIAEGMALAETLFGKNGPQTVDYDHIPTAVFSQPPLGTCGLTEADARAKYGKVDVYTSEFRPLKHTMSGSTERTFMKMIVKQDDQRVVGVHIVGDGRGGDHPGRGHRDEVRGDEAAVRPDDRAAPDDGGGADNDAGQAAGGIGGLPLGPKSRPRERERERPRTTVAPSRNGSSSAQRSVNVNVPTNDGRVLETAAAQPNGVHVNVNVNLNVNVHERR